MDGHRRDWHRHVGYRQLRAAPRGRPPENVSITITLSDPVSGHFTQMTETRNGSTTSYTYPNS